MKQIPACDVVAVAGQLGEAGNAVDIACDAVVFVQASRGLAYFAQNRAAAEQTHMLAAFAAVADSFELVHAAQDAIDSACLGALGISFDTFALRQRRLRIVFVHQRDVVEESFAFAEHSPKAVVDDDRELEGVAGIVGDAVRNRRRQQMAVAVLMLQALAVQRGAASGGAHEETARLHVAPSPCQVADALESEHRVEDVEGNERVAMGAVGRCCGEPGGERAGFVDAFFQHLAVAGLAIGRDFAEVLGLVELPFGGVDAELPEHAFHAERARLVWNDRHDAFANVGIARQRGEQPHEGHRRGNGALSRALQLLIENGKRRHLHIGQAFFPLRNGTAELGALAFEIDGLRRIGRWTIVRHVRKRVVA